MGDLVESEKNKLRFIQDVFNNVMKAIDDCKLNSDGYYNTELATRDESDLGNEFKTVISKTYELLSDKHRSNVKFYTVRKKLKTLEDTTDKE